MRALWLVFAVCLLAAGAPLPDAHDDVRDPHVSPAGDLAGKLVQRRAAGLDAPRQLRQGRMLVVVPETPAPVMRPRLATVLVHPVTGARELPLGVVNFARGPPLA